MNGFHNIASTLIEEQFPVGKSTIRFGTIPDCYNNLQILFSLRSTAATDNVPLNCYFNDDTTAANYRSELFFHYTNAHDRSSGANAGYGSVCCGANSPSGAFTLGSIFIQDYRNNNIFKHQNTHVTQLRDVATIYVLRLQVEVVWKNTLPVRAVSIVVDTGVFARGSTARLYGYS